MSTPHDASAYARRRLPHLCSARPLSAACGHAASPAQLLERCVVWTAVPDRVFCSATAAAADVDISRRARSLSACGSGVAGRDSAGSLRGACAAAPEPASRLAAAAAALRRRGRRGAMTTIRRFVCDDLLRFNNVNLDPLTETVRLLQPRAPLRRALTRPRAAVPPAVLPAVPGAVAGVLPFRRGARRRVPRLQCVPRHGSALRPRAPLTRQRAVMGKAEGRGENWHGHVTAVTVRRSSWRDGRALCSRAHALRRWRRSTAAKGWRRS